MEVAEAWVKESAEMMEAGEEEDRVKEWAGVMEAEVEEDRD
jgi:hypothetical protein